MEPGEFQGVAGRTLEESTPWWPPLPSAPEGAPNIVVVLLDDVGYAQFGCYGSTIATPTFDRLAARGLRYSNFHTTALCSPTRACLLTGRNHHRNGMGRIVEFASGFPGYDATMSRRARPVPTLRYPDHPCGCSSMVRVPAFQAGYAGSIPVTRSAIRAGHRTLCSSELLDAWQTCH